MVSMLSMVFMVLTVSMMNEVSVYDVTGVDDARR